MKKILMSAAALVFGVGALSAQGPWFIGADLGVNYNQDVIKDKTTTFEINPEVGYMFNDNWGVTLDAAFGMETVNPDAGEKVTTTAWGIGVGAVYMLPIVDKFYFAPNVRVGYGSVKEDTDGALALNVISANLNVLRFEYKAFCKWAFTLNFGGIDFVNAKVEDADNADTTFGLNIGRTTEVGVKFYF